VVEEVGAVLPWRVEEGVNLPVVEAEMGVNLL